MSVALCGKLKNIVSGQTLQFEVLRGIHKGNLYSATGYDSENFFFPADYGFTKGTECIPRKHCRVVRADGLNIDDATIYAQNVEFPFRVRGDLVEKDWFSSEPTLTVDCSDGIQRVIVVRDMYLVMFFSPRFCRGTKVELDVHGFFLKSCDVYDARFTSASFDEIKKWVFRR